MVTFLDLDGDLGVDMLGMGTDDKFFVWWVDREAKDDGGVVRTLKS